jgi:hypothetical protein
MVTAQVLRSLIARRHVRAGVMLWLIVLTWVGTASAGTAPAGAGDHLSGTWQVSRTCISGCTGTTKLTEVVQPFGGAAYRATGSVTMLLYRIGTQKVLVHAATSSSLLTIRVPGRLMRGPGVAQDGSTFRATWHCIAALSAQESTPGALVNDVRPQGVLDARGIC